MPELPHFNPSVSVFHLSSKVSNAKIRKYKLATERGMMNSSRTAPRQTLNSDTGEDAKQAQVKQNRLKLKVRNPSENSEGDNIIVAQPRQNGVKRDWKKAFGTEQHKTSAGNAVASSSGLSSAGSEVSPPGTPDDAVVPPKKISNRESYGDLMSYYIQDDEPTAPENAPAVVSEPPRATNTPTARQNQPPRPPRLPPQAGTQSQPASRPSQQQSLPPAITPLPALENFKIGTPDPVPVMIAKLEALSQALTDFGGVPPKPPSPQLPPAAPHLNPHLHHHPSPRPSTRSVQVLAQYHLSGQHDIALTYGIQFIINALRSWAQQRLAQLHMQATANGQHADPSALTLAGTPEGRAIAAFRAVVESGCLRVGTIVPVELSRALRHLYLQIDHLINQGTKREPPWRCLSYRAQILANQIRVDHWKAEQTRAEQEMVRQHQVAHQQMMRQMGLPAQFTSTMFYQQPQDAQFAHADTRRQNQNLIRLPEQAMEQPMMNRSGMMQGRHPGQVMIPAPPGHPYMAKHEPGSTALLPRSGQSMQFSFQPQNEAAYRAFGAHAFPQPMHPAQAMQTMHPAQRVQQVQHPQPMQARPPAGHQESTQLAASIVAAVNARVAEDENASASAAQPPRSGFVAINAQHV